MACGPKELNRVRNRSMTEILLRESYSVERVYQRLRFHFGENAPGERTIYEYQRKLRNANTCVFLQHRPGRGPDPVPIDDIRCYIRRWPNSSTEHLANHFQVAFNTMSHWLEHVLKMKQRCLRWVPHLLDAEGLKKRETGSARILSQIKALGDDYEEAMITGDETFIYFNNPQTTQWVEEGEEPDERVRRQIGSEKVLHSMFFNGLRLILIHVEVDKATMTSTVFKCVLDLLWNELNGLPSSPLPTLPLKFPKRSIYPTEKRLIPIERQNYGSFSIGKQLRLDPNERPPISHFVDENLFLPPEQILFPRSSIEHEWKNKDSVKWKGLSNIGQTCYINASIQCLAFAPPFVNWLNTQKHSTTCLMTCFSAFNYLFFHFPFFFPLITLF